MKQKYKKIVFWKIIVAVFVTLLTLLVKTFAQYYYFDDGWKSYQQWCVETLDVKVMNSEWRQKNFFWERFYHHISTYWWYFGA